MARVGYMRVSTGEQNLDLQRDALESARVDRIFEDTASGAQLSRPGLDAALDYLREGDELVVWRLDRFSRSTVHALTTIDELASRGVAFRSLTEGLETTGPTGRLLLTVLAAFAQLERDVIRQRTLAGLAAAREQGRLGGRPPVLNPTEREAVRSARSSGRPAKEIARDMKVSLATVYRALEEMTMN
ncbi:recombinase family protein [Diaminobutyricibacter sp. McL0618]|uniref:recombinase family protein n=1 Tax=Leifsonia sp. McL0618 TaxID=3415677 RepID=UPI003CF416F0